ncbi:MAG: hypothetical protein J6Q54_02915 [Oscillospiraceae bacterium]|nr:hypothetical protein [Oscillospiraceae bacterium]
MKNAKMWLTRSLLLVLVVTLTVVFAACGGTDKKENAGKNENTPTESISANYNVDKVYWRTKKYLDEANNTTLRVPDENGIYTAQFYCDGETVDVQFKDKTLVETIDSKTNATCHFGFVFDGSGYAVEVISSAEASGTVLQCERYDITKINEDGSYEAAELIKYKGDRVVQGKLSENCVIYDISPAAKAEKEVNRRVDSLQLNDRVCIWTDENDNAVLIYITTRRPDTELYFNPYPQYNATTKKTERTVNGEGYYEIELLKAGETELQTYYVEGSSLVNTIDKSADRCIGLLADENNVIQYVYDMENVLGQTYFCRGYYVTDVTGLQVTCALESKEKTGIMTSDCKVWNVSGTGEFGAETQPQVGDCIYAGRNPYSEIVNIYVVKRG